MKTLEQRAARWLDRHTLMLMRVALGIVFVWFGALKFCPGLCDVELMAQKTMVLLTFGLIPAAVCTIFLGAWECAMGLTLLFAPAHIGWGRIALRICTLVMLAHLAGTFLPLVLFPAETWKHMPFAPTLAGQYILKNIVLATGALSVCASTLGAKHQLQPGSLEATRLQLVRRSA